MKKRVKELFTVKCITGLLERLLRICLGVSAHAALDPALARAFGRRPKRWKMAKMLWANKFRTVNSPRDPSRTASITIAGVLRVLVPGAPAGGASRLS
jgi:hypothetical protein